MGTGAEIRDPVMVAAEVTEAGVTAATTGGKVDPREEIRAAETGLRVATAGAVRVSSVP